MKQEAARKKAWRTAQAGGDGRQRAFGKRFFAGDRWTAVVTLALGLAGVCGYAVYRQRVAQVGTAATSEIPFADIHHSPLPKYVPGGFLAEVRAAGQFSERIDTSSPDLLKRLHGAFARHPWVEEVERVEKSAAKAIHVGLRFRAPAAMVALEDGGVFLVDRHGFGLPEPQGKGQMRLLTIHGLAAQRALVPGERATDGHLLAAAELAGELAPHAEKLELVAIDVGVDRLQPDLRLRTRQGTHVIWQTIGNQESSTQAKRAQLEAYCRDHGSLSQPAGPYLFDVRAGRLLRKPLR